MEPVRKGIYTYLSKYFSILSKAVLIISSWTQKDSLMWLSPVGPKEEPGVAETLISLSIFKLNLTESLPRSPFIRGNIK